jgi:hypothetical protein
VPKQSPDQPVKIEDASGVAVSVTTLPASKLAWQMSPQLIPAGLDVTTPERLPVFGTARLKTLAANVAVTERASDIVSWQLPVPEQSPDHPVKLEDASGVAVRVTAVPASKLAWHE